MAMGSIDVFDHIIAVGKGAAAMAWGIRHSRGEHDASWSDWHGPIVVPTGTPVPEPMRACTSLYFAGHPLPTDASRSAGNLIGTPPDSIWSLMPDDLKARTRMPRLWFLLSGGASSLMIDPPPEISVSDYRAIVEALLLRGASILELNTVRKHIDFVKGGWLARTFAPLDIRLLVLSDVLGDDLSTIGSGPLSPDPTSYTDAIDVLEQYDCLATTPVVTEYLRAGARGEHPETPKPGDGAFDHVHSKILANNATAVESAVAALSDWNLPITQKRNRVAGEARVMGRALAEEVLRAAASTGKTRALVWGGETTVDVGDASGKGGRNLELALAAAIRLEGTSAVTVATYSTDGVDGPTDAAGAIVTGQTCQQARAAGLDPEAYLRSHDSYSLFDRLDKAGHPHLIRTGPTGTNVNDIAVALIY